MAFRGAEVPGRDALREPLLSVQSKSSASPGDAPEQRLLSAGAATPAGCTEAARPRTIPWVPSLTVSWITPLVQTASVRQLQEKDLPLLPEDMRPGPCGARLWELWLRQQDSLAQPGNVDEHSGRHQNGLAQSGREEPSPGDGCAEGQSTDGTKKGKKGPAVADAPSLFWPLLQAFGWEYVWAGLVIRVSRARTPLRPSLPLTLQKASLYPAHSKLCCMMCCL